MVYQRFVCTFAPKTNKQNTMAETMTIEERAARFNSIDEANEYYAARTKKLMQQLGKLREEINVLQYEHKDICTIINSRGHEASANSKHETPHAKLCDKEPKEYDK